MIHITALSGGKDSTALALRMAEVHPELEMEYLITPTGDELPEMYAHWENLETLLGKPFIRPKAPTLRELIDHFNALPNFRQRWCTRMIKIQPCLDWIRMQPDEVTLYVGLRADEEERQGIYSNDLITKFPLREWGWGINNVWDYLNSKGIGIPFRTDCARCYNQRISEWFYLWRDHKSVFADSVNDEARMGHTFRSEQRDTWPAKLSELAVEFEKGRIPRGVEDGRQLELFESDLAAPCRVCSL